MHERIYNDLLGWMAEWLCSGLQSRVRRFDSGPRLKAPDTYEQECAARLRILGRLAQLVSALA